MDCNRALGAKALFTPFDRATFLDGALHRRYERELALWSEDEIEEMSRDFQRTIRARKRSTELLLMRLRGVQWRVIQETESEHEPA